MKFKFIFILSLLFISACSSGNFIKKGFEDFTTYFNTYYNAKKIFVEAEIEIKQQQKEIFTDKIYAPPGNITNKLVTVIEKCSKILQYHPQSSLVDNALFLIGKSYYYQREFPSAIRKFTELITNFPNSSFVSEARLYIARSYLNSKDFDRALRLLNEIYEEARQSKNRKLLSEALLEMILINFKNENYDGIIRYGEEFVKVAKDDELIAMVLIQMGKAYTELNNLDDAVKTVQKVNKYTSDNFYRFKSQLELAKVYRKLNNLNSSESILKKLSKESNFQDYNEFIELEFAYLYYANGDTSKAINQFIKVDTTYGNKETGGLAQFELGFYFENVVGNYDSAKYYYDKCQRTPVSFDVLKYAQNRSNILTKHKNLWNNINALTKQIVTLRKFPVDSTYVPFQEIEIDSTLLNDPSYVADLQQYFEEKRIADSLYQEKLKADSATYLINLKNADSLDVNVVRLHLELATLFLLDYDKPDSALPHLYYAIDRYPDYDFAEQAFYALANYYDKIGEKKKADSLFMIIYERFQDTEISKAVAKRLNLNAKVTLRDSPETEYYQGEQLVSQGKYKDALKHFNKLLTKYEKTDYEPKILLMIGHIYEEKLLMNDSAFVVYKTLREKYPSSLYAQRISPKLIAYEIEQSKKEQQKLEEEEHLRQQREKQEIPENLNNSEYIQNSEPKSVEQKLPESKTKKNPKTKKK